MTQEELRKQVRIAIMQGFSDMPHNPTRSLGELSADRVLQLINQHVKEVLGQIDPLDLVERCKPDCTPVEHAYHEGTWKAHLALERKLTDVRIRAGLEEKE